MTRDAHQIARELAASGSKTLAQSEQAWLNAHLMECEACRAYSAQAERVVGALRAVPMAASRTLVSNTQLRVRLRARQLQRRRERLWLVSTSCVLVGLIAALTTPVLWTLFARLGSWANLPNRVWQLGFVMFWIAPTIATSFLFLAYGTHLADHNGNTQGS